MKITYEDQLCFRYIKDDVNQSGAIVENRTGIK